VPEILQRKENDRGMAVLFNICFIRCIDMDRK